MRFFKAGFLSFVLLASCFPGYLRADGTLGSVPELEMAMYPRVEGYPCVRLLNLSGEIGCSNPGRVKIVAPLIKLENVEDHLVQVAAILISAEKMNSLFLRVLNDPNFAKNVAGVLIESWDGDLLNFSGSPTGKFPLSEFAPYKNASYEWNPYGSDIMWNKFEFPVFLLSKNSTSIVQEFAGKKEKAKSSFLDTIAEFNLVMQTTTSATRDSNSCLKARTCLPLGGYSVWSSLPPINVTSPDPLKPVILAISSMDSASFFRDRSLGADSPLSGLISLLAAVDALSHVNVHELKKQLVFVAFTGEAWGFLGSRRFIAEMDLRTDATKGLNSTLIEKILEVGSVGKGLGAEATTFFAHTEKDSVSSNQIVRAMEHASNSFQTEKIVIKKQNSLNPGVPPSSIMAFLGKNSSTTGVVLEDFDNEFTNKFFDSHFDGPENIKSSSVAAAASLIARTLYILAKDDLETDFSVLNSIKVNESLVEELIGCLLSCEPGLSCELVKKFISPSRTCPSHYAGVLVDSPDSQNPQHVDDTSRFVWNFLANRTGLPGRNVSFGCSGKCDNAGEICVGFENERKGRCVISTTRYVPAYSTRLRFHEGIWHVLPANSSDPLGIVDPVWTESFWNYIGFRVYMAQSSTYDHLVLVGGVVITIASYAAVLLSRALLMKAMKHD